MCKNVSARLIALILALLLAASCSGCGEQEKGAETTVPSTSTSPVETTAPPETTAPTEQAKPTEGTEPTDPSQGTEPPVTEPKPTEPPVTEPKPTDPPVTEPKPTDPPVTEPPVVIQPSTYPTEPEDEGYKGVTPDNLSEETVKNWDADDYNQFKWKYWDEMTPQEQYDYLVLSQNNGVYYRCGKAGHHCMTPLEHERREAFICTYCGQNNCAGWGLRDGTMDTYNYMNCSEYNVFKDPMEYCQACGKQCTKLRERSITKTCNKVIMSANCLWCGEWVEAGACHTCKEENLKPEFKQYIIDTPTPIILAYTKSYITDLRNTGEAPQNQFTYENVDGGVMITGYLGSSEILVFPKMINGLPVVEIKNYFFAENSTVKAVMIPDTVKVLNETFSHNQTIQAVICEGVETIMPGAFYGCYSLQEVVLGKGFMCVDTMAFYNCISLVKLINPTESSVFTFMGGALVFHGCDRLTIYSDPNGALAFFAQMYNPNIKVEALN